MIQNQKETVTMQNRKPKAKIFTFEFWFLVFSFWFLVSCNSLFAKEITILYTGETHAMLYPCSCPIEPDGGVSRRASLIKELRENSPDILLLDSGDFFAGGSLDQNSQDPQLDKARTVVNIKAMALMKYDAVAIGEDEFNFGKEFLGQEIKEAKIPFVCCNIKFGAVPPYIIKKVGGVKIGIIGVTNPMAAKNAAGVTFTEPKTAVAETVAILKKKNASIIILLSHLDENEGIKLINEVKGIDIFIIGHSSSKGEPTIDNTLVLRPDWQGRRLGKVSLTMEGDKITGHEAKSLRLSDNIADDPKVVSILPHCFGDDDCRKEGFVGTCDNGGTLKSNCLFSKPAPVDLFVITLKDCVACNTQPLIAYLKKVFPGLNVFYLYYPQDQNADVLIKKLGITGLPAYLLGKEAEQEKKFAGLKENLEIKGKFYMLKPQLTGLSYFLGRKEIKGALDVFISLYDKNSKGLLARLQEFNPTIHFLALEQKDKFEAVRGPLEVEEYLRAVCVQKYYPKSFWDYIICRSGNINDTNWEQCAVNLAANKIKACAQCNEGVSLLRGNTGLNKELGIMFGPTYLLDNQQIFSSNGVPSTEELKRIIKR
jgi:hypothetical protein